MIDIPVILCSKGVGGGQGSNPSMDVYGPCLRKYNVS